MVLEDFLKPRELPEIKQMLDSTLRLPSEHVCRRPHNTLAPLRWDDSIVLAILDSASRLQILQMAAEATDLRWISGYISIKEPCSPALWWHQDWWCWDHPASYGRAPLQVALLCYLSKTSMETGALRVLPGSHHRSVPLHALLPEAHAKAEEINPEDAVMNNLPGQVTFSANAGDAVLIDYRLLHGTQPNHGLIRRDCVILNFAPHWRRLPTDIRAHLIRHPAQPTEDESVPTSHVVSDLLPTFSGERHDLPLSRNAPAYFQIEGD